MSAPTRSSARRSEAAPSGSETPTTPRFRCFGRASSGRTRYDVDPKPFGIASGFNAVWVGSNQNATVSRIDPDTLRVVKRIDVRIGGVNPGTYAVATGAGAVWALNADVQSIERIDPQTNRVVATIPLPFSVYPRQLSADGDEVWVSVTAPGEGP